MTPQSSQTAVHVLACHEAVKLAARGLPTIARCSDRPIQFVIHDDGSLQPRDCEHLQKALGAFALVSRHASDELVESLLARFPQALKFRQQNPLALKLLDIPLLATGSEVACCDTDVVAFRPFSGLFDWPDPVATAVFMPDSQNAYAMRPWHLLGFGGIELPVHVNTGLMLFRRQDYDLDFIEWFLGRRFDVYDRIPGWVEQTCWAALGARGRCWLYDSQQVRVIRDANCLADHHLAIGHFTRNVRDLWSGAKALPHASAERVPIRTCPAAPLTATGLARDQVRRVAMRYRSRTSQRTAKFAQSSQ